MFRLEFLDATNKTIYVDYACLDRSSTWYALGRIVKLDGGWAFKPRGGAVIKGFDVISIGYYIEQLNVSGR
jgi:hypothetical protein